MVRVTSAPDCRWLDATEVTRQQYQAFLGSNPSIVTQDAACVGWNESFHPDASCLADSSYTISTDPEHPQVCVDQCDAMAFCAWAGKKLCPTDYSGQVEWAADPWFNACTEGGKRPYPYGSSFDAQACNGLGKSGNGCPQACTTFPAGSLTTCVSKDGIADLVGSVAEWSAGCDATNGETDHCVIRGGWFATDSAACDTRSAVLRTGAFPYVGFRCCAP